jgi:hypothetical protein
VTQHIRNPRRVKPWSGGPIPDSDHRNACDMRPPPPAPALRPALDAYELVGAWRWARLNRDWANAAALLAELERLARRPAPRAEGDRFDTTK